MSVPACSGDAAVIRTAEMAMRTWATTPTHVAWLLHHSPHRAECSGIPTTLSCIFQWFANDPRWLAGMSTGPGVTPLDVAYAKRYVSPAQGRRLSLGERPTCMYTGCGSFSDGVAIEMGWAGNGRDVLCCVCWTGTCLIAPVKLTPGPTRPTPVLLSTSCSQASF